MNNFDFKIENKALYEIIADKIETVILNDTTKISQKLPSEQHLADSFGVSRPVIREALKILKERGLVSSRQGAPTIITDYNTEHFVKTMNRIACMKNVSHQQIYQIRNNLEILSVKLAVENREQVNISELKKINSQMNECTDNIQLRAELDVDFHKTIARMSGNPLLEFMMESLSELLQPLIEKSIDRVTDIDGILLHDKIIAAIESGDEDTSCDLMRSHLMLSVRNFEFFSRSDTEK